MVKDKLLTEQVSKFVTDQSAEFFAIETRQELGGMENVLPSPLSPHYQYSQPLLAFP